MNKYSDIEIQIANDLLRDGYKWLVRNMRGNVVAFSCKPPKNENYWLWPMDAKSEIVSGKSTPLFQNIQWGDMEPTYIEDIINPPIINESERRYLSAVIRPFRDQVLYIVKGDTRGSAKECISIHFEKSEFICFPKFKKGTMYKGMETNKEYTLEELGL